MLLLFSKLNNLVMIVVSYCPSDFIQRFNQFECASLAQVYHLPTFKLRDNIGINSCAGKSHILGVDDRRLVEIVSKLVVVLCAQGNHVCQDFYLFVVYIQGVTLRASQGKLPLECIRSLSNKLQALQLVFHLRGGVYAHHLVGIGKLPNHLSDRIIVIQYALADDPLELSRLEMPVFPKDKYIKAVLDVVKANIDWVPPYGSGAQLYIRPYMFGSNAVIGVKPAAEYQFRILVTPVGPYFKGGVKPIKVRISDRDRAAPHGTGDIKAGLNYAMSLSNIMDAHRQGYAENIYLDPASHTYIEETGGANILCITKEGKLITPKSNSILPSITRRSLLVVAKEYLGLEVEERQISKEELADMKEIGLCGTAAVISPIGQIDDHGKSIMVPSGMDNIGPVLGKLRETLTGIQMGTEKAPEGWVVEIK